MIANQYVVNDALFNCSCLSTGSIQIQADTRAETRFCMLKVVSHNTARFIDQMAKQQKLTVTGAAWAALT